MRKNKSETIRNLVQQMGGSFFKNFGIDLKSLKSQEAFRWLLASILFGSPISEKVAAQTFRVFDGQGVNSPKAILDQGWDRLVQLLDEGGYARYDFKTATKLLDAVQSLLLQYGGDLNRLHKMAEDPADLERRLQSLAKGIGPVTTNIFLREMRGIWGKADPLASDLCIAAAQNLDLIPRKLKKKEKILAELKALWRINRVPGVDYADFEAALVRWGIENRKKARSISK